MKGFYDCCKIFVAPGVCGTIEKTGTTDEKKKKLNFKTFR